MTDLEEKKARLKKHYDKIKHYLTSDLAALRVCDEANIKTGCGPYLLTTCSGIDFLGSLCVGSGSGFKYYITEFLGKVHDTYKHEEVADYIYNFARSGQIHEAIVKPTVIIGEREEYHLKILNVKKSTGEPEVRLEHLFIDTRKLADDFLESLPHFDKVFEDERMVETMANRLFELEELTRKKIAASWQKVRGHLDVIELDEKTNENLYEFGSSSAGSEYIPAWLKSDYLEELKKEDG